VSHPKGAVHFEAFQAPDAPLYAVTKTEGSDRGLWTTIGAARAHRDGKGFSVKLDYLPLNGGAEIVIREPRAEQALAD
jgi:hypothetical protein